MNSLILREFVARCDKEHPLTLDDIAGFASTLNMSQEQFYEAVLLYAADEFCNGNISFDTGDAVANTLWGISNFSLEGNARAIFLAFDEGEYHHKNDPVDLDPIQHYTLPQIEAILRGQATF